MTSVRLRLLVLALAPLTVLIPALLLLGMTRWTQDYDEVLIANVESDLRIAEQYLARIMAGTGNDLTGLANSVEFSNALEGGPAQQDAFFSAKQQALELDFLYYLDADQAQAAAAQWPVIAAATSGTPRTEIDILNANDLAQFPGNLDDRARIQLIPTEAAVPTDRVVEDRGMVVHSASPVTRSGQTGVLVGGVLLNRNLDFIDSINALVYLNAVTGGSRQGTATLFLDDVRVSTNVRLFEDVRALGTRVSAAVRYGVLEAGETWLNRAFVVNDWYISGYLPLTDSFGNRVGMLYVGFLEAPFTAAKREALLWMLAAFAGVMLVSIPVFLSLARGVFAPLEQMTRTMRKVGKGDLSARNKLPSVKGEIGQVAAHLDDLLDQVQDRDARLRAYAEELNQRVEERTAELRTANRKLEETFQQLVMREKLAAIGEITAGVAHEINNPVAVIQGNMDVIRDELGADAKAVETEIELIDSQVARIRAIVGKLLQFAGPADFADKASQVALAPLIEDCLALVEHLTLRNDIELKLALDDAPDVAIDPGEMQQVVVNLIVNGVQAMGDKGTITISLKEALQGTVPGALITLRDTGPGIPPLSLDVVFDPFFTTKPGEGSGLGLSISQTLVQQAGGLISVRNHPDGGAEFSIWLPSCAAVAGKDAAE